MIDFWTAELPTAEEMNVYFSEIIESGALSFRMGGKFVSRLEEKIREHTGRKYAVVMQSGTTALILLLSHPRFRNSGIIMPAFTFSATMAAAIWNRLPIRFVDIDPSTWLLDPEKTMGAVSDKYNIVMPVNMFGNPPDYDRFSMIRGKQTPLYVLSDAAQSLGSQYKGYNSGFFSDAEVFSFSFTKIVTGSEGGAVVTNDKDIYEHMLYGRHTGDRGDYNPLIPGIGAKMSELQAALTLKTFETLDDKVKTHIARADLYRQYLYYPEIQFQKVDPYNVCSYKEFTILVPSAKRDAISKALKEAGVDHRQYWNRPLNETTLYRNYEFYEEFDLPVTRDICKRTISLPMHHKISEKEISYISAIIKDNL